MADKPTVDQESFYEFQFPYAGVELKNAFSRQMPRPGKEQGEYLRTCRSGVNVRGYEPSSLRRRGGSRPGLARYVAAPVLAGWIIQDLNVIVVMSPTAVS